MHQCAKLLPITVTIGSSVMNPKKATPSAPFGLVIQREYRAESAVPRGTQAHNDVEMIQTWLTASTGRSRHTFLSYRRESSRFLLFIQYHGLTLAQVMVEHVHDYFALLADPPPAWCIAPRGSDRLRSPTAVLKGALSAPSIAHARVVLLRLYRYLQDAGYAPHNPIALAFKPPVSVFAPYEKALEPQAWQFFWQWLQQQAEQAQTREQLLLAQRNRWLCALLYHTGLRRSSVAAGVMAGFSRRWVDGESQWSLTVPSKGGRLHTSMVSPLLLQELRLYRQAMGLIGDPEPHEQEPLVCAVRNCRQLIKERAIGLLFEQLTAQAAACCADSHIAAQIAGLTAHGLRHTHGTHRFLSGASLQSTQASLGHKDPKTTLIYAKVAEKSLRHDALQMDDFMLKNQNK